MNNTWHFVKSVGCGNDFIFFDNREGKFPIHPNKISALCHRQNGIGADGVILLENSNSAHFHMRIFNSDGTEAEMCGNGIRCLMKFLQHLGFQESKYNISTLKRHHTIEFEESHIKVEMGDPTDVKWDIPLSIDQQEFKIHFLNTGVPHVVLFVQNLDSIDVKMLGQKIRSHSHFAPQGTNVNFAQVIDENIVRVRTYERGVEDETLACGTGATAVAIASAYQFTLNSPISIETKLKENLKISFSPQNNNFKNIYMSGPAVNTFQGSIQIN